jgi:hypothetical protein
MHLAVGSASGISVVVCVLADISGQAVNTVGAKHAQSYRHMTAAVAWCVLGQIVLYWMPRGSCARSAWLLSVVVVAASSQACARAQQVL